MKMNLPQSCEISETTYTGKYSSIPEALNLPKEGSLTHFAPTGETNETKSMENSSNPKVTI
jgi:hypothetical protein